MASRRTTLALVGLALIAALVSFAAPCAEAQLFGAGPEFRALWVDAFHDGVKTADQVDRLLADARRANLNAVIVQVRRRGDSYYSRSLEPRTEDASLAPGFDSLDYLIDRAHNGLPRLEVHAWIATYAVWNERDRPPRDPSHVFNQHGPNAPGRDNWLLRRDDGETWANGYFLDPGHPEVARYTADVALNLVREYDLDGLHLDYVRYPEGSADHSWGYNETSVARFNARYGRDGVPDRRDPQWSQWRRDQVTALVRRICLGALAAKPQLKVSAAVIPWGAGPASDADWSKTAAYSAVFQDWRAWLEEGILDLAIPMDYYRESVPPQGAWFDRWVAWQREHAYGRQMAPGIALYLNTPAESINQLRRALASAAGGTRVSGVALYSYGATRRPSGDGDPPEVADLDVWAALASPVPANDWAPPFPAPVSVPAMGWKTTPQNGSILLRAPGLDGARVEVGGPAVSGGETDGNGVYGLAVAPPGHYALTVRHPSLAEPRSAQLDVMPGAVSEIELR